MKTNNIYFFILLILVYTTEIFSLPGNHEGLTCTILSTARGDADYYPNKLGKYVAGYWSPEEAEKLPDCQFVNPDDATATGFSLCQLLSFNPDSDFLPELGRSARATALEYIDKHYDEIVARLKSKEAHAEGYSIGMWGDSLTHLLDALYGRRLTVEFMDLIGATLPYPDGTYGGNPNQMDSWEDYFVNFSAVGPGNHEFKVMNNGVSTWTTSHILKVLHTNEEADPYTGLWGVARGSDHCTVEEEHKVAINGVVLPRKKIKIQNRIPLRNTMMIGGNDVLGSRVFGAHWPFLNETFVRSVGSKIETIADWHIENGKQILLEGTIPIFSTPVHQSYNTEIINRHTLCHSIDDVLITPDDDIPWYLCAVFPGQCEAMAAKVVAKNKQIIAEIESFYTMLWKDQNGDMKIEEAFLKPGSITQACINDWVKDKIGPRYRSLYPNHVAVNTLYDAFNNPNGDANFWVPHTVTYIQDFNKIKEDQELVGNVRELFEKIYYGYAVPVVLGAVDGITGIIGFDVIGDEKKDLGQIDRIHIGPVGYVLRSFLIGNKLKELGWDGIPTFPDDSPEPIVNYLNFSVGKRITKKALDRGLYGRETGAIQQIPAFNVSSPPSTGEFPPLSENPFLHEQPANGVGLNGGYYQLYTTGHIIIVKQIGAITNTASYDDVYGPAYVIEGDPGSEYKRVGGPWSAYGFPTSDLKSLEAGWKTQITFECGKIWYTPVGIGSARNSSCDPNDL